MTDTIIKGSGNSRTLGSVPNAPAMFPDYPSFIQALAEGKLPIDLGPLDPAGCLQIGMSLIKATLLSDETETSIFGDAADRTPDQALAQLKKTIATVDGKLKIATGSYVGTRSEMTLTFGFQPKAVFIVGESTFYSSYYRYCPSFGCIVGESSFACGVWSASNPYTLTYGESGTITETGALIKPGHINATGDNAITYYYLAIG